MQERILKSCEGEFTDPHFEETLITWLADTTKYRLKPTNNLGRATTVVIASTGQKDASDIHDKIAERD